jgi:toxin YoeB
VAERTNRAPAPRDLVLEGEFWDDLQHWLETDQRTARRIGQIVRDIQRDPFRGVGKPEPLRHVGADTWSRRITQEHRLVYRVTNTQIRLLRARGHYDG